MALKVQRIGIGVAYLPLIWLQTFRLQPPTATNAMILTWDISRVCTGDSYSMDLQTEDSSKEKIICGIQMICEPKEAL